jgi:hypothetical protein
VEWAKEAVRAVETATAAATGMALAVAAVTEMAAVELEVLAALELEAGEVVKAKSRVSGRGSESLALDRLVVATVLRQGMAAARRAAAGMGRPLAVETARPQAEAVRVEEEAPQERREAQVAPEAAGVRVSAPLALAEAKAQAVAVVVAPDLEGGSEEDLEAVGANRPTTKSSPFCER